MSDVAATSGRARAQRHLARHLAGSGLELGPGHSPFPLPHAGTTVRYVDRWHPEENRGLFPELHGAEGFGQPDIVADLDVDRLAAVPDASQDFVIASHVLEHLAEPLGMLAEICRVLRPGGHVLILLPDRRRTFDRTRQPTSYAHLLAEHRSRTAVVDDAHVEDFLVGTGEDVASLGEAERSALFDLHRRRSIHVHCWTEREWADTVAQCLVDLQQEWLLIDLLNNGDVPDSIEFGMVLRKDGAQLAPEVRRQRFEQVLDDLGPDSASPWPPPAPASHGDGIGDRAQLAEATEPASAGQAHVLQVALEQAREDASNWRALATDRHAKLLALSNSPLGPPLRLLWAARQRLQRRIPPAAPAAAHAAPDAAAHAARDAAVGSGSSVAESS